MNKRSSGLGIVVVALYLLSVVAANWLITHVGPVTLPNGDHLVPVGFGLMTPSGTFAAGFTLVARDLAQRTLGRWWSVGIILVGGAVTLLISTDLAVASTVAFLCGETLDFLVYTPLRNKGLILAVLASSIIGGALDTVVFLSLAGIPLLALSGTLLGKLYVELGSVPLVKWTRSAVSQRSN